MQRTCVLWLAVTAVIYFFCTVSTVYGRKCSGRWAIHACYGGNGKRSSPSTDNLENLQRNKQFILGQLLLKNRLPVTEVISNYPEQADLLESDNIYPESDDDSVRQRLLEKMSSLLSDMLLNRRLQDSDEDTEPFY